MIWALAIKTALGNVYHLAREGDVAACSRAIRLEAKGYEKEPDDGYRCARCQVLSRMNLRNLKQ